MKAQFDTANSSSAGAGSTASFGPCRGHAQRVSAGQVLFQQGESVEAVFRVRHGLVKLLTHSRGGEARIVRLQRSGDWLGLAGFLDEPHGHTAVALGNATVERFALEHLSGMRIDHPDVLNDLLSQWHRDLAVADVWIAEFSAGSIRSRVARLIRYLAGLAEVDAARVHIVDVARLAAIRAGPARSREV